MGIATRAWRPSNFFDMATQGRSGNRTLVRRQTAAYFVAFAVHGMIVTALGPSLPHLATHVGREVDELSILFAARSAGTFAGALLGGYLYDHYPGHRLSALVLLVLAGLLLVFPQAPLLALLAAVLLFVGLGEGVIGVGTNAMLTWVHGINSGPYLNGLHFFFGAGAFLAPLLLALSLHVSGYIAWGYAVLALALLPLAAWLLRLPSPLLQGGAAETNGQARGDNLLLFSFALFLALYVGAEIGFGGWVYSYALARDLADEMGVALLNSAFWGAFTLGRLVSIPLAARWRPSHILQGHLLLALLSVGLLLAFEQKAAAWAATIGLGLALAPIFPTTVALAGKRLHLSGRVTAWLFVGASSGAMVLPWLLGRIFGAWGPTATMAALLIDVAVALLLLVVVLRRGK